MNRLKPLSIALLILLPVLTLGIAISIGSLGFFVYSLPGAVTPGLAGLFVAHYSIKHATVPVMQRTDEDMVLETES